MTDRTCSIEGCGAAKRITRGWCHKHYVRWLRHGDPLAGRTFEGEPVAHYDQHLMTETDECKVWPYYCNPFGYGELIMDGQKQNVHVLACIAWHGPRPEGMEVAHGPCNNPSCWNGAHLSWKTKLENERDKFRDGTDARGEQHGRALLTDDQVRQIRVRYAAGETSIALGPEYGVHHGTIRKIANRETWRHIA